MLYYFHFGRDKELAKVELCSLLGKRKVEYTTSFENENGLCLDIVSNVDIFDFSERLAGTRKIYKAIFSGAITTQNFIEHIEFYFPKNFEISVISLDELSSTLTLLVYDYYKKYIKTNKYRGTVKLGKAEENAVIDEKHMELVVAKDGAEKVRIFQLVAEIDSKQFKFKDTARPHQKFTHGTSFRLARMMVNMLNLPPGSVVLDPFCGIGTFLIEAMQAGYNVIGVDNDRVVVEECRSNVDWAKKTFKIDQKAEIVCADSINAYFKADGVIFEPYMGPFLKELPDRSEASKITRDLESLYKQVFRNLSTQLSSDTPLVCIMPIIVTNQGSEHRISPNVFTDSGFVIPNFTEGQSIGLANPIKYMTPSGSKIGRVIWRLKLKK